MPTPDSTSSSPEKQRTDHTVPRHPSTGRKRPDVPPKRQVLTQPIDFEQMSLDELRHLAQGLEINDYLTLSRDELEDVLREYQDALEENLF